MNENQLICINKIESRIGMPKKNNMFNTKDIADYYNQTLPHYSIWWKLSEVQSLHYGIWESDTKSFKEALINTNITLAELAGVEQQHRLLDVGCGVGGAAFYLAEKFGCKVTGITLSDKQLSFANELRNQSNVKDLVVFEKQDFTATSFPDNTFDIVWACESICHASPKVDFIKELYRILKPGGKFIMADYLLTTDGLIDTDAYMKHWGDYWAITEFNSKENMLNELERNHFTIEKNIDITDKITPSAKKMYLAYLLGSIPSMLYNLTHNTSRFAKTHYLSGKYQYKALKKKLWTYNIILAVKK